MKLLIIAFVEAFRDVLDIPNICVEFFTRLLLISMFLEVLYSFELSKYLFMTFVLFLTCELLADIKPFVLAGLIYFLKVSSAFYKIKMKNKI